MKPVMAAAAAAGSIEVREEELVLSAQAGNREAFEALFRRYRDRIAAFVRASVRDEGRTEDLVQEIFFSAHHSLGTLSNPSAFRPWLYQIARNACLDEARRRSRQDELILGWEEFPPPDERIVVHSHGADRALSQKEELSNLTQAFDGLPESQHEALVLRELEGMSYDEIGRRMKLSRPAVESMLFRARRVLKGEYTEIQTGERCKRMQAVMADVAEGMGDLRERRKLIRHMRDCVSCRHDAAALGLAGLAMPSADRRGLQRAFSRVAAFLPFPAFFSRRAEEGEHLSSAGSFAAQAQGAAAQLTTVGGDQAVSAIHKAAAVVAAVAVVGGGGVAIQKAGLQLPVKLPGLDAITANKHLSKSEGTTAGAGGKLPPADPGGRKAGGNGAGAGGPVTPSGGAAQQPLVPGSPGLTLPGSETPAGTGTPLVGGGPGSPGATVPGVIVPGDATSPAAPDVPSTGGAGKPQRGKDKSGSGGSDNGGSAQPGATDQTPPALTPSGEPIPPGLPKGIQEQLESGKRTLDDLPAGQRKKLAAPSTTTSTTPAAS